MLRSLLMLSLVLTVGACDKKKSKEDSGVQAASVDGYLDVIVPPVIRPMQLPDIMEPVMSVADAAAMSDGVMLVVEYAEPELDISPVVHAQVQDQVQEEMQKKAEKLKKEAEEIRALLREKKEKLGKKGFEKWRATRGGKKSHFMLKGPPRPPKHKPRSLIERLEKLKK